MPTLPGILIFNQQMGLIDIDQYSSETFTLIKLIIMKFMVLTR